MKLVSFLTSGEARLGLIEGDQVRDLSQNGRFPDLGCALEANAAPWENPTGPLVSLDLVQLGPPVRKPPKVMAVGLNYHEHAAEQAKTPPDFPMFFAKGRTCICGPTDPILLPAGRAQIDVEAELVAVIGRPARNLTPEQGLRAVFGYTIGNDVSDRQAQRDDKQFYRAKSFETFGPIGPWVMPGFDPGQGRIQLLRNGEIFQDSDLQHMIFSVGRLVSELSKIHLLEPGDLIFTGTPSGVGAHRQPPVWLRPGDQITCRIDGLGELSNPVANQPAG